MRGLNREQTQNLLDGLQKHFGLTIDEIAVVVPDYTRDEIETECTIGRLRRADKAKSEFIKTLLKEKAREKSIPMPNKDLRPKRT